MKYLAAVLMSAFLCQAAAIARDGPKVSADPDDARFVTTDIENFWQAYDHARPDNQLEVFERDYFKRASVGLEDFTRLRIGSVDKLVKRINQCPGYYASIRQSTMRIESMQARLRASFYALKYIYPEAVFPDVYFVIGILSSGGTTSSHGLLIGSEMYGRTPASPDGELNDWLKQVLRPVEDLPNIVAHELIHYQQKYPADIGPTLLRKSIEEGSADFIAEMISGGNINEHLKAYANPRERELWEDFKTEMYGKELSRWLYNGSSVKDRPADLGYYMGYKIAESYYKKASDKRRAIKDILEIRIFPQFLKDSGYEAKFGK